MFTRHTISSKVLADTKECRQMLLVMASRSFLAASAALDQIKMMRFEIIIDRTISKIRIRKC